MHHAEISAISMKYVSNLGKIEVSETRSSCHDIAVDFSAFLACAISGSHQEFTSILKPQQPKAYQDPQQHCGVILLTFEMKATSSIMNSVFNHLRMEETNRINYKDKMTIFFLIRGK